MSKIFYDHLIVIEEVIAVLDQYKLSNKERQELLALIDETLHHEVLDVILSCLPESLHNEFLTKFHKAPHDPALITYLKEKSDINVELAILGRVNTVKRKLIKHVEKFGKK